jgi:hypothetical protein
MTLVIDVVIIVLSLVFFAFYLDQGVARELRLRDLGRLGVFLGKRLKERAAGHGQVVCVQKMQFLHHEGTKDTKTTS